MQSSHLTLLQTATDSEPGTGENRHLHESHPVYVFWFKIYTCWAQLRTSYSPVQLNDFVILCFLLNNEDISTFSPNRGEGRRKRVGTKAILSTSKILFTFCESRFVVIYLDTVSSFCISQDEGAAIYF